MKELLDNEIINIEYKGTQYSGIIIPKSNELYKYTLYLFEETNGRKKLVEAEPMDYTRFNDSIIEKYKIDIDDYPKGLGYIQESSKNDNYDFKIKHIKSPGSTEYTNG